MFEVSVWLIELLANYIWRFLTQWECFFFTALFVIAFLIVYKAYKFGKIEKGSFYDND